MKIILGSNSPRRKEILSKIGLSFDIRVSTAKEYSEKVNPVDYAKELSLKKSKDIEIFEDELLITADTIVAFENEILGKPKNEIEAFNMLKKLSGKKHVVITGITFRTLKEIYTIDDTTEVYFHELSDEIIKYYIKNYKPLDKAGSYGIQDFGGTFIEKINGDYYNVMGLPLNKVFWYLYKKGVFNG
ncbi:septum formation protein [Marinitoga hydrogenitolerans DSM 16785]|uniref:dTTP/UTP pyrophosphatase n=1 Tax=Marinitoga hydrogenitolerans (strain DSM 16785 / JCM 12826 / AT1271) TaxID=1122195 RepID=A0A1M4VRQ1_MARH1|nr:Maf family protein [Marinitoga hydrogenitolerans]SHE71513.1 septum formation protein [Marinitoga hydrogenitolerans DSM 16785]